MKGSDPHLHALARVADACSLLRQILDYISSPAIVIPLLVLLVLVIFYQFSLAGSLRESNNDLRNQLRRERTEERRKMFKMADRTKETEKPFDKWSRLLENTFAKQKADGAKPPRTQKEKEARAKGNVFALDIANQGRSFLYSWCGSRPTNFELCPTNLFPHQLL